MHQNELSRRRFLRTSAAAAGGAALTSALAAPWVGAAEKGALALQGGSPVRSGAWPAWPVIEKNDVTAWNKVLQARHWCRLGGSYADAFEKAYARLTGTKYCTATANGTSALFASLNGLGVGPGDEVLVPPYTCVATINVVLLQYALPVSIDSDRQTFQIDAARMADAIDGKTACLLPVHLGGNAADLDAILALGKKHSLPVLEDA